MRNSIFSDFISLFFPRYCYACKNQLFRGEEVICLKCQYELPITNYHYDNQNPVMIKMYGKSNVAFASAYLNFVKSGRTQQLIHQLKYHNRPEIGNVLGKWYAKELSDIVSAHDINMVIPVPLHKNKKKKRGYNQSESFAEGLSESLNIEMNTKMLIRIKENTTQTNKSKIARWENVENIFKVTNVKTVIGANILLVDDVVTTGFTVASCANELLKNGAASVGVATIAMVDTL